MKHKKQRGQLIVLSGPSGVGKSTVIAELLGQRDNIYFSVSYTTRTPRVGEQDGVNYNFVSRDEFERMIAANELLEYAQYVGNYYGTSLKAIQDKLEAGVDVLLDIEVQGAAKVRARCPDAIFIFIILSQAKLNGNLKFPHQLLCSVCLPLTLCPCIPGDSLTIRIFQYQFCIFSTGREQISHF